MKQLFVFVGSNLYKIKSQSHDVSKWRISFGVKPHINWLMSRCTDGGDATVAPPIFNHPWCKFNAQKNWLCVADAVGRVFHRWR